MIQTSAYQIAERYIGIKEVPDMHSNPTILTMLRLDQDWPTDDEVPWCSAFVNYVAWLLRLPRSKSLLARSWLAVGRPIQITQACVDADVVILKRGDGSQPGPEIINAPGHVGFYAGLESGKVLLLGGNQNDGVCIAPFSTQRIIGVRRLV